MVEAGEAPQLTVCESELRYNFDSQTTVHLFTDTDTTCEYDFYASFIFDTQDCFDLGTASVRYKVNDTGMKGAVMHPYTAS